MTVRTNKNCRGLSRREALGDFSIRVSDLPVEIHEDEFLTTHGW